jgi:hypothetical protein
MKGRLLFSVIFLISPFMCLGQDPKFYEMILRDAPCRYCYFLAFDVESPRYTGRVVIEHEDLFRFLNETRKLDRAKYRAFLGDLLLKGKRLSLGNRVERRNDTFLRINGTTDYGFRIVNKIDEIEMISSKGCASFIRYYFMREPEPLETTAGEDCKKFIANQKKDLYLERRLSTLERSIIISKLFAWGIPIINNHDMGMTIDPRSLNYLTEVDKP